jgi:plastocyanin
MRNMSERAMSIVVGFLLLGFLFVPSAPVTATTHTVTQSGLLFSPESLTIARADTVVWIWTSGTHTVTNGTGAGDPSAGSIFDAALDSGNPIFQYVFASEGSVGYFCRIHESAGMKGVITVQTTATESNTWGRIKSFFR